MIGCAADVRTRSPAGPEWQRFSLLAEQLCRHTGWEFVLYPTFIHIAAPRDESDRKWNGGKIKI